MLSRIFCMPPVVAQSRHCHSSQLLIASSFSEKAPILTRASARHPRTLAEEVLHQAQICDQLANPKGPNHSKPSQINPNLAEPCRTEP